MSKDCLAYLQQSYKPVVSKVLAIFKMAEDPWNTLQNQDQSVLDDFDLQLDRGSSPPPAVLNTVIIRGTGLYKCICFCFQMNHSLILNYLLLLSSSKKCQRRPVIMGSLVTFHGKIEVLNAHLYNTPEVSLGSHAVIVWLYTSSAIYIYFILFLFIYIFIYFGVGRRK